VGMVLGQQSTNSHVASVMEHKGTHIDIPYLKRQMKKDSDLHRILQEAKDQLAASEGAQAANEILCDERGVTGSLFDDVQEVTIFNIDKQEHRQILFQDVLGLEPVSGFGKGTRPNGKKMMSLTKVWQSEHREVYEVSLFTRVNKVGKLISSYIKSFHEKVTESDDGKTDGRLRPSYGFLYVKTGRGNSFKPSLQQTPTRSKEAKYVKRMFTTAFGFLKLKTDFSANEVRFAANIAGDKVMADPFNVARDLRTKMFRAAVKGLADEVASFKNELKTRGDIHIQNVFRFFNKWVAKSDPLRDAIKGVVFGVIYGKSAATLGRDIWSQRVNEIKDKVYALRKQLADDIALAKQAKAEDTKVAVLRKKLQAGLNEMENELDILLSDKTKKKGEAQAIMEKMAAEWKSLYRWMARMHEQAANDLYVEAPHGRRRHLYGMLIDRNDIQAALCRRAVNAPVQGFGADVGHTAARILDIHLFKFQRRFKLMTGNETTVPG
jgi:DNA polymerase I-like protein with 3'-5' exonuclease and polymerase domains